MGMGMYRFRCGGSAKQFGYLGMPFLVGLFCKSQVFSVGLGFAGKSFQKVLFGFGALQIGHVSEPPLVCWGVEYQTIIFTFL
jgi:hypothetical protein